MLNWVYAWSRFELAPQPAAFEAGVRRRLGEAVAAHLEYVWAHLTPERNHRTLELFAVVTTVLAFTFEHPLASQVRPDAVFAVVWLGMLGSGLAYVAFYRLIAHWGATRTALVAYLLPVVGILLGVIVLREQVDARTLLGTVLIIGGVGLVNSRSGVRRLLVRAR